MNRNVLTTCLTVLSGSIFFPGAALAQQQAAPPQAYYYNTPADAAAYNTAPQARDSQRTGQYGNTDSEAMLLDTIFLRPISLVGTAVGAAAWIVSLPFSLPSGSTGEAWEALVETPLNYTFTRPLGNLSSCRDVDPGCRYPSPW
jgi:hypothetical protein